jgi:hypothetical protein
MPYHLSYSVKDDFFSDELRWYLHPSHGNLGIHIKCGKLLFMLSLNAKYKILYTRMPTSQVIYNLYMLHKIMMETKYRVPTKSYISHT